MKKKKLLTLSASLLNDLTWIAKDIKGGNVCALIVEKMKETAREYKSKYPHRYELFNQNDEKKV